MMEFERRNDLQKLKDHSKLKIFQIEEPKKRKLLLILYGVDSSLPIDEFRANII